MGYLTCLFVVVAFLPLCFSDTWNDLFAGSMSLIVSMAAWCTLRRKLFKKIEDLRALSVRKTEFLSFASHQLRSPLAAISGYAAMLYEGEAGPVSDIQKMIVENMTDASLNLSHIVDDFLNIAKAEDGCLCSEKMVLDLTDIVLETVRRFRLRAAEKGVVLLCEARGQAARVLGDAEALRQALGNLIDNGIKYTKKGTVRVFLEQKKNEIVLSVQDTGIGIAPEVRAILFQKWKRGALASAGSTGCGVGLYLAKKIVEEHDGRIWVESEGPGRGSDFRMAFDCVE